MKFIPNVYDYFMEQTFNIRGNLVKDGSFDNNTYYFNLFNAVYVIYGSFVVVN